MGFLFLVLYPLLLLLLLLPPVHKSSLTHISLTHTSHNHTQPHSHTQAITHSLTHSHTHTHTSLTLHIHHAPQLHTPHSTPITHTTLITHSTPLHSTPLHSTPLHSTPLHSTPLTSLTHSAGGFCVAGAALGALRAVGHNHWLLHTHRGHALLLSATLPVAFAWQVRHCAALGALQAVGCIRPGVPWCRLQAVGWLWQVPHHLVLCKRSDVRPGVPWCSAKATGRATETKGSQGVHLTPAEPRKSHRQSDGDLPRRTSDRLQSTKRRTCHAKATGRAAETTPGAALGALQGVGCTPWRPLVSAALPGLLRGRCGAWCSASGRMAWQVRHLVLCKRSDVRPGVPWCSASGRMYALAFLGLRIITSRHMQQDKYISACIHLHLSLHTHTHTHTYNIRMYITYITNCLLHPVHISLTHYQSETPVHAHAFIHTKNPPSPLHHSHTSSSLVAFLCSV